MSLVDKSRYEKNQTEKQNPSTLIPNHLKEKILAEASFSIKSIQYLS